MYGWNFKFEQFSWYKGLPSSNGNFSSNEPRKQSSDSVIQFLDITWR